MIINAWQPGTAYFGRPGRKDLIVSASSRKNSDRTTNKNSVLIIDDNVLFGGILRSEFAANGFAARSCVGGVQALDALRDDPASVIIADYQMPLMNGVAVVKLIRSSFPRSFIIGISIEPWREDEFLEAGADAFLRKPFTFPELLSLAKG